MRPLLGLGHHVAGRDVQPLAPMAGERLLAQHAADDLDGLLPLLALVGAGYPETAQLDLRAPFARTEVDPTAGHEVERGDPLGDAGGMVDGRRKLDDAVAEPDPGGALARRSQEHLRRARVRVLLEEVVLDLPDVIEAERVGQLDLFEGVPQQLFLGPGGPRPGQLVLVEQSEPHGAPSDRLAPTLSSGRITGPASRAGRHAAGAPSASTPHSWRQPLGTRPGATTSAWSMASSTGRVASWRRATRSGLRFAARQVAQPGSPTVSYTPGWTSSRNMSRMTSGAMWRTAKRSVQDARLHSSGSTVRAKAR